MCTVSNISDDWTKRWPNNPVNPWQDKQALPYIPYGVPGPLNQAQITREEFEALKKEVSELKKLLEAAKVYDEATGQPDCHMEDKVDMIKKIAGMVGINMDEVFK